MVARTLRVVVVAAAICVVIGRPLRLGAERGDASVEAHSSISVVVNASNPQVDLSITDLRRILLGDLTRWPDGRRITVAMREPGAPEREALLQLVCRMTDVDFVRYQLHSAYRGDAAMNLKQLDTAVGIRRFVFNVPGAIGYLRSEDVDASVKVLRLSGAIPESPVAGFILRPR